MEQKLCGIFFDLDGTLANTLDDLQASVNHVLTSHAFLNVTQIQMRQMVGNGIRNLIERALPEGERTKEKVDGYLQEFATHYRAHCLDRTGLYYGIREMVAFLRLKEIPMAVISNKADDLTQKIVAALFPKNPFLEICGMKPEIPAKPNPQALLTICRKWGVAPNCCAMVGDSDVDILTGKNAGMVTVGVAWGFRGKEELVNSGADQIVENAEELLHCLLEKC